MPTTDRVMGSSNEYKAVFTDKKDNATMEQMDFLKLMVTQMQNQDFTNPMDNTQMVTQMAQFSNMQMMQEMANHSKSNYAISLVGKTVTATRFNVSGDLETTTGPVQKVSLVDNEYVVYVGDKKYTLDQIMSIESGSTPGDDTTGCIVDPSKKKLTVKDIDEDSAIVEWEIPTEDETKLPGLKYSLYYSTNKDFGTVEQVEKGTLASTATSDGVQSLGITDLKPGTTYYVNVMITDKNGKKAVYTASSFKTKGVAPEVPEKPEVPETPEVPKDPETPEVPKDPETDVPKKEEDKTEGTTI